MLVRDFFWMYCNWNIERKTSPSSSILEINRGMMTRAWIFFAKVAKVKTGSGGKVSCCLRNWVKFKQDNFTVSFHFLFCIWPAHFISDFPSHVVSQVGFKNLVLKTKHIHRVNDLWLVQSVGQKIPNLTRPTQNLWPLWFSWALWLRAESICWVLDEFARLCAFKVILKFTLPFYFIFHIQVSGCTIKANILVGTSGWK